MIAIGILTSVDLQRFKRALYSAMNQTVKSDILVVINSKDSKFVEDATKHVECLQQRYSNRIIYEVTKSDGTAGTGKTSLFHKFHSLAQEYEWDHLLPLDGDDFLYPWCVESLYKFNNVHDFSVLGAMTIDQLLKRENFNTFGVKTNSKRLMIPKTPFFLSTWNHSQPHLRQNIPFLHEDNPWTMDRLLLVSSHISNFEEIFDISGWSMFEDHLLSCRLFYEYLENKLSYGQMNWSYGYVYDKSNEKCVTLQNREHYTTTKTKIVQNLGVKATRIRESLCQNPAYIWVDEKHQLKDKSEWIQRIYKEYPV